MTKSEIKEQNLNILADHQAKLCREPKLRQLFFELTLRCNEACFHCGSSCSSDRPDGLPLEKYKEILDEVREHFGTGVRIALTGGEPLLYPDFFALTEYIHRLGFHWGMTSNGTLITEEVAKQLHDTGMTGISISIDGLPETHDRYRNYPGGYEQAMTGLSHLITHCSDAALMVTTVVNHGNIDQLDELFRIMDGLDIDSWRVINLEPIGRALLRPDLMLTPGDYRRLFEFIQQKRRQGYPLEYGCSHYLGLEYEAEVREWYWLCNAGVYTASIMANGDIGACLDIERRPETIQGNVKHDRLLDVWQNRFELFRRDLSDSCANCRSCDHVRFCRGDAHHSWDYDNNHPLVCLKDILF